MGYSSDSRMSILTDENQKKLETLLVKEGLVKKPQLNKYHDLATQTGQPLFGLLVDEKVISNEELTKAIATISGVPYVNLSTAQVDQHVLDLLPRDVAERFMAVPLGEVQNRLAVAMLDANNVQAVDYLASKINRPIKVYMASEEGIRHVLEQYHTNLAEGVSAAVQSVQSEEAAEKRGGPMSADIKTIVQDSPISQALSTILEYAAKTRAADIHIEPLENALKIRCRIDGVLREIMRLPKTPNRR